MTRGIEITLAKFMKLKPPTFSGSNASENPQRFIDGLERLWRVLGCPDIRVVELASFQLESMAYDWFDIVTRERSVGSPLLAWGEFSQLFMARFLPESVKDGLDHEFERLEQNEWMSVSEYPQRFIDGLERLWRALGCSDIRVMELASFQLESVAYDWFDIVTRERSVGSPPLAWGKYLFRSVVGSNRSSFAEVLSLALQLEQRQKEKGGSGWDSRKKQRVEGSQSSHHNVGVGFVPGYQVQQRVVSQRGGFSGQSFGTAQSHRSDQGRSSRTTFPQRHFGVTSTHYPICGRLHNEACFGDSGVCYQCGQTNHIRRDCPVAVTQPSSSHALAPAAFASSQTPSTPVKQFGGSSG
ncbi:Zinc finger, CCHC-type [Sesbania bispinosa]|nr:Zinc finger, CCHC-type [Sesbania bispinosa]